MRSLSGTLRASGYTHNRTLLQERRSTLRNDRRCTTNPTTFPLFPGRDGNRCVAARFESIEPSWSVRRWDRCARVESCAVDICGVWSGSLLLSPQRAQRSLRNSFPGMNQIKVLLITKRTWRPRRPQRFSYFLTAEDAECFCSSCFRTMGQE